MKLAVGQRDGYGVVAVVGVGWEVGRVVGGHVKLPARCPVPAGQKGPVEAGRDKQQDWKSVGLSQVWKSVRPSHLTGRAAGRPSAAAAGLFDPLSSSGDSEK